MTVKKTIATLAAIALFGAASCEKYVPPTREKMEHHLKNHYEQVMQASPKYLEVQLFNASLEEGKRHYVISGPKIRYYDTDHDMKTVEEKVIMGTDVFGTPNPLRLYKNLVRPGTKPQFGHEDHPLKREMTPEEMKRIDAQYQTLLKIYGDAR